MTWPGPVGTIASPEPAHRRPKRNPVPDLPTPTSPLDYDALMHANLTQVFGERDAQRRRAAIQRLYAPDAVLNEPQHAAAGHAAINDAVSALLAGLPPDFVFEAVGPAQGHHGIGVLKWRGGPRGGPVAVTGMDVAHFQRGVIHSLFVFLNPPGA